MDIMEKFVGSGVDTYRDMFGVQMSYQEQVFIFYCAMKSDFDSSKVILLSKNNILGYIYKDDLGVFLFLKRVGGVIQ